MTFRPALNKHYETPRHTTAYIIKDTLHHACVPIVEEQVAHGGHRGEIGGTYDGCLAQVEAVAEGIPARERSLGLRRISHAPLGDMVGEFHTPQTVPSRAKDGVGAYGGG